MTLPDELDLHVPIDLCLAFIDSDVCPACLANMLGTFVCKICGLDVTPILEAAEPD